MYKYIAGYKFPYRIKKDGSTVEVYKKNQWKAIKIWINCGRSCVSLRKADGDQRIASVSSLLGIYPGSIPVCKVDRNGEILKRYASMSDAAKDNYMSDVSVRNRVYGRLKNPFKYGFSFVKEER